MKCFRIFGRRNDKRLYVNLVEQLQNLYSLGESVYRIN